MTPRNVSFSDLAKVPMAIKIMQSGSKEEIDNLLYQYGYDVKIGYEIEDKYHRSLTSNEVVYGPYIMGYERQDQEWLNSGFASMEARMEAVTDPHLRQALLEMCKTGSADKTWSNKDTAKAVVRSEAKNYQKKN